MSGCHPTTEGAPSPRATPHRLPGDWIPALPEIWHTCGPLEEPRTGRANCQQKTGVTGAALPLPPACPVHLEPTPTWPVSPASELLTAPSLCPERPVAQLPLPPPFAPSPFRHPSPPMSHQGAKAQGNFSGGKPLRMERRGRVVTERELATKLPGPFTPRLPIPEVLH